MVGHVHPETLKIVEIKAWRSLIRIRMAFTLTPEKNEGIDFGLILSVTKKIFIIS